MDGKESNAEDPGRRSLRRWFAQAPAPLPAAGSPETAPDGPDDRHHKDIVRMMVAHREFERELDVIEDLATHQFAELAITRFESNLRRLFRLLPRLSFQRLPDATDKRLLRTFQQISGRWRWRSQLSQHAQQRPHGYAGDHLMIDWIQRDRIMSVDPLGRCIDMCFQGAPPARAVRNRRHHIVGRIEALLAERRDTARIVSVAAGPANEVRDLARGRFGERCEFVCIDHSPAAAEFIDDWVRHDGLQDRIRVVTMNPRQLTGAAGKELLAGIGPDVIFSAGLFDYLNDKLAARLTAALYGALAPGGLLLFGNFIDAERDPAYHLYKRFMKWVLDWHLIHRSARELRDIMVEGGIPAARQRVSCEPSGFNLFAESVKS